MYYPQYNNYNNNYNRGNNGITWVQGIEGAKAFQLMPNSNIILMDSEQDGVFYIKTSDNVGMCNLRVFNYKEVGVDNKLDEYVKKSELKEMLNELLGGKEDESVIQPAKPNKKTITR